MEWIPTIMWALILTIWLLERRQLRKSVRDWVGMYEKARAQCEVARAQRDEWKDLYRRASANYEGVWATAKTLLAMLEARKSSENKKEGF